MPIRISADLRKWPRHLGSEVIPSGTTPELNKYFGMGSPLPRAEAFSSDSSCPPLAAPAPRRFPRGSMSMAWTYLLMLLLSPLLVVLPLLSSMSQAFRLVAPLTLSLPALVHGGALNIDLTLSATFDLSISAALSVVV